jgi:hypothetical protein
VCPSSYLSPGKEKGFVLLKKGILGGFGGWAEIALFSVKNKQVIGFKSQVLKKETVTTECAGAGGIMGGGWCRSG